MIVPTTPQGRDVATLASGLLVAHLNDDVDGFHQISTMFASCGQMVQGLLFLSQMLAVEIANHTEVDPAVVAEKISLVLQGYPEPAA